MGIRVYYLDDEVELCENFSDYFSSTDIEIKTFFEPGRLIEASKTAPPDLYLIDYRLPGMTGDKVALALPPNIPKYLITGDISLDIPLGFKGILSKPSRYEDIEAILDSVLQEKKKS